MFLRGLKGVIVNKSKRQKAKLINEVVHLFPFKVPKYKSQTIPIGEYMAICVRTFNFKLWTTRTGVISIAYFERSSTEKPLELSNALNGVTVKVLKDGKIVKEGKFGEGSLTVIMLEGIPQGEYTLELV